MTRGMFEAAIQTLRLSGAHVMLDLSGVEFMDAAGLHVVERALAEGRQEGWLELDSVIQPQVQRLLALTDSTRLLRVAEL